MSELIKEAELQADESNQFINKTHWYDGWFYDRFIAPNQDRLFSQIKNIIEPDKNIIDIGCGTGRFEFFIADKCKSVFGLDISQRNIERANLNLQKNQVNNISFNHKSIEEIKAEGKLYFEYAVMTYVIHEVDETERVKLLNDISSIADKVIIGEYLVPRTSGIWNTLNEVVEFAAGKEHYHNFKSFVKNGGIAGLAKQSELKIIKEITNQPMTSQIVILSK